jgi:hypothetical protein
MIEILKFKVKLLEKNSRSFYKILNLIIKIYIKIQMKIKKMNLDHLIFPLLIIFLQFFLIIL